MEAIRELYDNYIKWSLASFGIADIVEIIIFAFLIYHLILWIKQSRAWFILKGAVGIFVMYVLAAIFKLNNIVLIFNNVGPYLATAVIIIFQPEIRRALEQLGSNMIFKLIPISISKDNEQDSSAATVDAIVRASFSLGRVKTGALIVIERDIVLDDYIDTGIKLDAMVSAPLLVQIFEHNTPLHDGAAVIRGNRVAAATCYLPLSENMTISKELGTRHRAGLGMSEATDALVVIVSEETGSVSFAREGRLQRDIDSNRLRELLEEVQQKPEQPTGFLLWKGKRRQ